MKKMLLKTDRLLIRPWRDHDREPFRALNSDPDVVRYLPDKPDPQKSDKAVDHFLKDYEKYGFSIMVVERIEDGRFLGFTGLGYHHWFPDEVGIGWRFVPIAWGHGYATEAAQACVNFAFNEIGLDHLMAFTIPENTASLAVMKRLDMVEERHEIKDGIDLVIYRLDAPTR